MNPLLSIVIPTYNRAELLKICLKSICSQIGVDSSRVEVLVSNNSSTDNTKEIIEKLQTTYAYIKYYEHSTNMGADYNIAHSYQLAAGKYVWVFSDDDLMLEGGGFQNVLKLLSSQDFGVVFLEPTFYRNFIGEFVSDHKEFSYELIEDPIEALRKRHFWITYITGTIINKDAVSKIDNIFRLKHSLLIQLTWVLPALFATRINAYVTSKVILGRSLVVVDFKLFYVFGTSYQRVLNDFVDRGILPEQAKKLLIDLIIEKYFPIYLTPYTRYHYGERPLFILAKAYWGNKKFWSVILPLIVRRRFILTCRLLKRPFNFVINKGLSLIYKRGNEVLKRKRIESTVLSLKGFGAFSKLPEEHAITNPQFVDIGHDFEALPILTIKVHGPVDNEKPNPSVFIGHGVKMGAHCRLDAHVGIRIDNQVMIGNRVVIADNLLSAESMDRLTNAPLYRSPGIKAEVYVSERVLIGDDVYILPGVTIGENSIIKARSIVYSNIPSNTIAGGNPAQVISAFGTPDE